MSTLPNLAGLPQIETPLAPARPNTNTVPSLDPYVLPYENPATGGVANSQGQTVPANTSQPGFVTQFETWLTSSSVNIVAVVIGLVLIAGAVWGFDQVRETVTSTAKGAAEIAAA